MTPQSALARKPPPLVLDEIGAEIRPALRHVSAWRTVHAGLGMILWGNATAYLSLIVGCLLYLAAAAQPVFQVAGWTCVVTGFLGALVSVAGQGFCCTAPDSRCRAGAFKGMICLACTVVCVAILALVTVAAELRWNPLFAAPVKDVGEFESALSQFFLVLAIIVLMSLGHFFRALVLADIAAIFPTSNLNLEIGIRTYLSIIVVLGYILFSSIPALLFQAWYLWLVHRTRGVIRRAYA